MIPGIFMYGIPTASDAGEAGAIARYVADHFVFAEKSKSRPDGSPVFCSPGGGGGIFGPTPHRVIVYTVTDKQRQDEILDLLRQYQKERSLRRPIVVNFYRDENWITWVSQDGKESGGHREKEELIRTEKLK